MRARAVKMLVAAFVAAVAVGAFASASALASGPPTVTTGPYYSYLELKFFGVSEKEAWLGGTVNPNGLETTYYFEYGTTTSYGMSTVSFKASGTSNAKPTTLATGLEPGRVYHYRLVASNSAGTTYGEDRASTPRFTRLGGFSGKSTNGTILIELGNGILYSCSSATITGEVIAETRARVALKMLGCGNNEEVCSNKASGEIEIAHMVGELGWITTSEAGMLLRPETGEELTSYKCSRSGSESTMTLRGDVIAPIRNAATEGTLIYNFEQSKGQPGVTHFEADANTFKLEAESTGFLRFGWTPYAFATELSFSSGEGVLKIEYVR